MSFQFSLAYPLYLLVFFLFCPFFFFLQIDQTIQFSNNSESGAILLTHTLKIFIGIYKVLFQPSLPQAKQAQLPQPFLVAEMLHTIPIVNCSFPCFLWARLGKQTNKQELLHFHGAFFVHSHNKRYQDLLTYKKGNNTVNTSAAHQQHIRATTGTKTSNWKNKKHAHPAVTGHGAPNEGLKTCQLRSDKA